MEFEVQTRRESGELRYFKSFKEAWKDAADDETVWKISFSLPNGERVRMVRQQVGRYDEHSYFAYSDLMDEVLDTLNKDDR